VTNTRTGQPADVADEDRLTLNRQQRLRDAPPDGGDPRAVAGREEDRVSGQRTTLGCDR